MCGIAGFIKFKNYSSSLNKDSLKVMVSTLSHRGPDFKDYWVNNNVFQFCVNSKTHVREHTSMTPSRGASH